MTACSTSSSNIYPMFGQQRQLSLNRDHQGLPRPWNPAILLSRSPRSEFCIRQTLIDTACIRSLHSPLHPRPPLLEIRQQRMRHWPQTKADLLHGRYSSGVRRPHRRRGAHMGACRPSPHSAIYGSFSDWLPHMHPYTHFIAAKRVIAWRK